LFFRHAGDPYFSWRASWGQRLVIDLSHAVAFTDEQEVSAELMAAVVEAEKQGVVALLGGLSSRIDEVRSLLSRTKENDEAEQNPLLERIREASAALHLVGVHRIRECLPFLREWESLDMPRYSMGSSAMTGHWSLETQYFRPIVQHSLKLLGEEPQGFATFNFVARENETRRRFPVPDHVADRQERAALVSREMSAEEVLTKLGAPDYIRRRSRQVGSLYEWSEDWEYDFRAGGGWVTLRLTWEERGRRGCLTAIEQVDPYWLDTTDREAEYLRF